MLKTSHINLTFGGGREKGNAAISQTSRLLFLWFLTTVLLKTWCIFCNVFYPFSESTQGKFKSPDLNCSCGWWLLSSIVSCVSSLPWMTFWPPLCFCCNSPRQRWDSDPGLSLLRVRAQGARLVPGYHSTRNLWLSRTFLQRFLYLSLLN